MPESSSRPGLQMGSSHEAQAKAGRMRLMVAGTAPSSAMASSALGPPLVTTSASTHMADAATALTADNMD